MEGSRRVYSRKLKIAAMRELDTGRTMSEVARQFQLAPKLLERWRGEWRAQGEYAFPGSGHYRAGLSAMEATHRVAELERKIGQLTIENDSLKEALYRVRRIPERPS